MPAKRIRVHAGANVHGLNPVVVMTLSAGSDVSEAVTEVSHFLDVVRRAGVALGAVRAVRREGDDLVVVPAGDLVLDGRSVEHAVRAADRVLEAKQAGADLNALRAQLSDQLCEAVSRERLPALTAALVQRARSGQLPADRVCAGLLRVGYGRGRRLVRWQPGLDAPPEQVPDVADDPAAAHALLTDAGIPLAAREATESGASRRVTVRVRDGWPDPEGPPTHPTVALLCARAAWILGLSGAEVDLVGEGLTEELFDGRRPRVAVAAVRRLGASAPAVRDPLDGARRVPLLALTGTNGKTTTTRMLGHVLGATGHTVGMTSTTGVSLGGLPVTSADATGPASARVVLGDPGADIAVLETARGGIVRRGLGYDFSDVGVVTTITPDHLGQDGIDTLEDLVAVKSLVVRAVRPGGAMVLNADDPVCLGLRDLAAGRTVILTSAHGISEVVRQHCSGGGRALVAHDGWLVDCDGERQTRLLPTSEVPGSLLGAAVHQVANALSALAAAIAIGADPPAVADAMRTFTSTANLGRGTLLHVPGGHVLIDYGHNPEALCAVGQSSRALWGNRVHALITLPGDRRVDLLQECARAAARSFGQITVHEDVDRRGRQPGEVPAIVAAEIRRVAPNVHCRVEPDTRVALLRALDTMPRGGLVVLFHESPTAVLPELWQRGARPVDQPVLADVAGDAPAAPNRDGHRTPPL